jgi:Amt family ammonium transporter
VCGIWGVLAVGIFADGSYGGDWNATGIATKNIYGVIYGHGGWGQLGAQALGVLTLVTVMFGIVLAFFKIQNKLTKGGIRPTAEVELEGLDLPEMGVPAYPDFHGSSTSSVGNGETAPVRQAVPISD